MDRRGFLKAMLAAGVAPAIVRASSLMKIVVPTTEEVWEINMGTIPSPFVGIESMDEELIRLTRKAFLPRLITQLYATNPLAGLLNDL